MPSADIPCTNKSNISQHIASTIVPSQASSYPDIQSTKLVSLTDGTNKQLKYNIVQFVAIMYRCVNAQIINAVFFVVCSIVWKQFCTLGHESENILWLIWLQLMHLNSVWVAWHNIGRRPKSSHFVNPSNPPEIRPSWLSRPSQQGEIFCSA